MKVELNREIESGSLDGDVAEDILEDGSVRELADGDGAAKARGLVERKKESERRLTRILQRSPCASRAGTRASEVRCRSRSQQAARVS